MGPNPGFAAPAVLAALHLALYLTLQLRPGVAGALLWYAGPPLLAALALLLLAGVLISAVRYRVTWDRRRAARLALVAALAAAPAFYRTYPSSHDGHPSRVRFDLPLSGPVTVAWGGADPAGNAHVVAPDQRWGYDLVVTARGASFRGDGRLVTDYLAYGREVRSPARGIVHEARDGEPDMPIGRKGRGDDLGNHVALQVAPREFLYIAHLQPGSVAVRTGDAVTAGQLLGRVGNSGFSSEPHVHLHLQDSGRRHLAEGIPFEFLDYCRGDVYVARGMPAGGRADGRWTGHVVRRAHEGACGDDATRR